MYRTNFLQQLGGILIPELGSETQLQLATNKSVLDSWTSKLKYSELIYYFKAPSTLDVCANVNQNLQVESDCIYFPDSKRFCFPVAT